MRNMRYATTGFDAWNNASYRLKHHQKAPTHQDAMRAWMQRRRYGGATVKKSEQHVSDAEESDDASPRIKVRGTGYGQEWSDDDDESDDNAHRIMAEQYKKRVAERMKKSSKLAPKPALVNNQLADDNVIDMTVSATVNRENQSLLQNIDNCENISIDLTESAL